MLKTAGIINRRIVQIGLGPLSLLPTLREIDLPPVCPAFCPPIPASNTALGISWLSDCNCDVSFRSSWVWIALPSRFLPCTWTLAARCISCCVLSVGILLQFVPFHNHLLRSMGRECSERVPAVCNGLWEGLSVRFFPACLRNTHPTLGPF